MIYFPRGPSVQMIPTLSPKACKFDSLCLRDQTSTGVHYKMAQDTRLGGSLGYLLLVFWLLHDLLRVSRKEWNILHRAHTGIIFPYSLLTESKMRGPSHR